MVCTNLDLATGWSHLPISSWFYTIMCGGLLIVTRIGVLWSGDHVFDKVPETLQMLKSKGTSFM